MRIDPAGRDSLFHVLPTNVLKRVDGWLSFSYQIISTELVRKLNKLKTRRSVSLVPRCDFLSVSVGRGLEDASSSSDFGTD